MSKWFNNFLQKHIDNSGNDSVFKLSGPPKEFLCENLKNIPPILTDKPPSEKFLSVLSGGATLSEEKFERADLVHAFEERVAIAEYDGQQNTLQAQRIAYQDAFVVALITTPYEAAHPTNHQGSWFPQRIKESQAWLVSQGIYQPQ